MRTLYIDCQMGAAGDMLSAALLELLPDPDAFLQEVGDLHIPGVRVTREASVKCGITGTHLCVQVNGEEEDSFHHHHHEHPHEHAHHHGSLHEIEHILSHLDIPKLIKYQVLAVYDRIAQAESQVHGVPVSKIHFHEVGSMDAIADILMACMLLNRIAPEQVIVSPVHVGSGSVRCAHGILPVPAPATALLLQDVPIYGGSIQGELCTPTGAALLTQFATAFGPMPMMKTTAIGYGMGKKDFPQANCVRIFLGDTQDAGDTVVKLECNLDDMTPEAIGFAMEQLLDAGALDVFTTPIGMKKCRPGTLLSVLCRQKDKEIMVQGLFKHTTTLGIREQTCSRYTLQRREETLQTPYGPVRKKVSTGYGVTREKLEYADLAEIARSQNLSFSQAEQSVNE